MARWPKYTVSCRVCDFKIEDASFLRMAKRAWEHTGPTGECPTRRAKGIIDDLAEKSKEGAL